MPGGSGIVVDLDVLFSQPILGESITIRTRVKQVSIRAPDRLSTKFACLSRRNQSPQPRVAPLDQTAIASFLIQAPSKPCEATPTVSPITSLPRSFLIRAANTRGSCANETHHSSLTAR